MSWILLFIGWWASKDLFKTEPELTKKYLDGHFYICNSSGGFIHDPKCKCMKPSTIDKTKPSFFPFKPSKTVKESLDKYGYLPPEYAQDNEKIYF